MKLYDNIKRRRIELGMTQKELADALGYSDRSAIAHIEKGKIDLPQSKIVAFAKALSTTPGDLMGDIEPYPESIEVQRIAYRLRRATSEQLEVVAKLLEVLGL